MCPLELSNARFPPSDLPHWHRSTVNYMPYALCSHWRRLGDVMYPIFRLFFFSFFLSLSFVLAVHAMGTLREMHGQVVEVMFAF
ncbi:hypothetical protein P170DRAFT_116107 [Aspergillus steynii IBT 23096]|uniref:Uncharacterized protein n=1 Tax=Aspergillus steynii IBT 23096 TaxID=1392250 RepID=A0A2I2GJ55_9EURO|nr:uncharacterized protein P170DRAFT_116107 [Aspergillus steynii IBT 23096]PLB52898.1 hypothetical protein P170DRAFT_116107 [Aspergillus steynii IBT 23096]